EDERSAGRILVFDVEEVDEAGQATDRRTIRKIKRDWRQRRLEVNTSIGSTGGVGPRSKKKMEEAAAVTELTAEQEAERQKVQSSISQLEKEEFFEYVNGTRWSKGDRKLALRHLVAKETNKGPVTSVSIQTNTGAISAGIGTQVVTFRLADASDVKQVSFCDIRYIAARLRSFKDFMSLSDPVHGDALLVFKSYGNRTTMAVEGPDTGGAVDADFAVSNTGVLGIVAVTNDATVRASSFYVSKSKGLAGQHLIRAHKRHSLKLDGHPVVVNRFIAPRPVFPEREREARRLLDLEVSRNSERERIREREREVQDKVRIRRERDRDRDNRDKRGGMQGRRERERERERDRARDRERDMQRQRESAQDMARLREGERAVEEAQKAGSPDIGVAVLTAEGTIGVVTMVPMPIYDVLETAQSLIGARVGRGKEKAGLNYAGCRKAFVRKITGLNTGVLDEDAMIDTRIFDEIQPMEDRAKVWASAHLSMPDGQRILWQLQTESLGF
ncbi:hypothetical protein KIPB_008105, partial [Kipferlia bialata]